MGSKLYVGGLPYAATESQLTTLFAAHGTVESARVITDKFTGQSRGFGFVEMATQEEAKAAITALNGSQMDGRPLTVNEAKPQEPRTGGGGGGGRFGGGGRWGSRRTRSLLTTRRQAADTEGALQIEAPLHILPHSSYPIFNIHSERLPVLSRSYYQARLQIIAPTCLLASAVVSLNAIAGQMDESKQMPTST